MRPIKPVALIFVAMSAAALVWVAVSQLQARRARLSANRISTQLVEREHEYLRSLYHNVQLRADAGELLINVAQEHEDIARLLSRQEPYYASGVFLNPLAVVGEEREAWIVSPRVDLSRPPLVAPGLDRYCQAMEVPMRFVLFSNGDIVPLRHVDEVNRKKLIH